MKKVLVKTPQYEAELANICNHEYRKINGLLSLIEKEFDTDMNQHPALRHEILNISNFIKRLPTMISEVVTYDN